jgi:hypothetical protein
MQSPQHKVPGAERSFQNKHMTMQCAAAQRAPTDLPGCPRPCLNLTAAMTTSAILRRAACMRSRQGAGISRAARAAATLMCCDCDTRRAASAPEPAGVEERTMVLRLCTSDSLRPTANPGVRLSAREFSTQVDGCGELGNTVIVGGEPQAMKYNAYTANSCWWLLMPAEELFGN